MTCSEACSAAVGGCLGIQGMFRETQITVVIK